MGATGQLSLAYLTADTHGLTGHKERLKALLETSEAPIPQSDGKAVLLQPPTPIFRGENWPLLAVTKSTLSDLSKEGGISSVKDNDDYNDGATGDQWEDDDLFGDEEGEGRSKSNMDGGDQNPGWDDDELNLSDDDEDAPAIKAAGGKSGDSGDFFLSPQGGTSPVVSWCNDSSHAADHFAAGSVDSALQLLNRQIALVNASLIKPLALSAFLGCTAFLPGLPLAPVSKSYLMRELSKPAGKPLPAVALKTTLLLDLLKQVYRSFTSAQFIECRQNLDTIIQSIPLVVAGSRTDTNDLKELLDVCREYITALRVKAAMSETVDPARSLELAAYFTHCNLLPAHLMLALNTAMANAFKSKNFINAASFARRLLELPDINSERHAEKRMKAQKVLQKSEQQGRNEFAIDYDEMNPFSLDCEKLKPIYKGTPSIRCPYCASIFSPESKGRVCPTCKLCSVGQETVGLITQAVPSRNK